MSLLLRLPSRKEATYRGFVAIASKLLRLNGLFPSELPINHPYYKDNLYADLSPSSSTVLATTETSEPYFEAKCACQHPQSQGFRFENLPQYRHFSTEGYVSEFMKELLDDLEKLASSDLTHFLDTVSEENRMATHVLNNNIVEQCIVQTFDFFKENIFQTPATLYGYYPLAASMEKALQEGVNQSE
jgi:hypothetical protein